MSAGDEECPDVALQAIDAGMRSLCELCHQPIMAGEKEYKGAHQHCRFGDIEEGEQEL